MSEPVETNANEAIGSDSSSTGSREVHWSVLDLDEIADAYHAHVSPDLREDDRDPGTAKPTYEWLRNNDHRSLVYALRKHHDLTFDQFWRQHICDDGSLQDQDAPTSTASDWSTDDDRTIDALSSFLTSRRDRKGLARSSIDTLRYRLDRYVDAYARENGSGDLIAPVARDSDRPAYEAVDACWAAFDRLHAELGGARTKHRIHLAVSNWYSHLVRRKRAAINPAEGLDEEFDWSVRSRSDADTPCLDSSHVRALYETANDVEDRLLVVALCAWGLRPSEVASLHVRQFVLDVSDDVPHIAFEERKNGPGEVSLLYGRDVLEARIAAAADQPDSTGHLFPSSRHSRDHVSRWTVWNRFRELADEAGLPEEIDGVSTSPKLGRRFWYDAYSASIDVVLESLDEIAHEQGSASADVVLRNYLSDARARDLRREYMRERLSTAFE